MARFCKTFVAFLSVLVIGAAASGVAAAGEPERHVVNATEIQARIDQQMDKEGASREAIQRLLRRPEVREIAGRAGLDINRASAGAAVLSGPELEALAAQANEINAGVGGTSTVVISTTTLIIILLIIIIVAR